MIEEYFRQLNRCALLKDDWDEDGAPAPNAAALAHSHLALEVLGEIDLEPLRVLGDVGGGIGIDFEAPDKYVWLSLDNSGTIMLLTDKDWVTNPRAIPTAERIEPNHKAMKAALLRAKAFLSCDT